MHRKISVALLIAVLSALFCLPALAGTNAPGSIASSYEWAFLESINAYRAENGLQPLSMHPSLQAAADARAAELSVKEHTNRPDGSAWSTALSERSFAYSSATQCYMKNLKNASKAPVLIMNTIRNSENAGAVPFRNALLSGKFTHIGIGSTQDGYWLWILTGGGCTLESCTITSQSGDIYTENADIDSLSMVADISCSHGSAYLPVTSGLCRIEDGNAALLVDTAAGASAPLPNTPDAPTALSFGRSEVTLSKGGSISLPVQIAPLSAKSAPLTWTSSDTSVAAVSSGSVTGVSAGEAIITVHSGTISASCKITVVDRAENIKCDVTSLSLGIGQTYKARYLLTPSGSTESVTWSTYPVNSPAVKVSNDGTISTGTVTGKAYVVATTASGLTARIKVTVVEPEKAVQNVRVSASEAQVAPGGAIRLLAKAYPVSASDRRIHWFSSDPAIVTVDSTGIVTGVSKGQATVYAVANSGVSAQCNVTVRDVQIASLRFKKSSASIYVGQEGKLTPAPSPSNAPLNSLTWHSSDPAVAAVDANGRITALKKGSARITVTASTGASASIDLEVKDRDVTAIKISKRSTSVYVGVSGRIKALVGPVSATNKTVLWSSSAPHIVSVDENGNITALSAGTAVITAASESNPEVKTTCTIHVYGNTYKRSGGGYKAGKTSAFINAAYFNGDELRVQVCYYNGKPYAVQGDVFGDELLFCSSASSVAKRLPIDPEEMYAEVLPAGSAEYVVYTFSLEDHPDLSSLNLRRLHPNSRVG